MSIDPVRTETETTDPAATGNLGFLGATVDALPLQVWTAGPEGEVNFVSGRVRDYFGRSNEEMLGAGWLDMLHPDDVQKTVDRWTDSVQNGTPYETLFRLRNTTGEYRWHLGQAVPTTDDQGQVVRWYGTNADVHDRVVAEEALQRSEKRAEFLAMASKQLAESLDYEETLRSVARLSVPEFADWCAVDLLTKGELRRVAVEHPDPEKVRFVQNLQEKYPTDPDQPHGVHNVIRTGRSEFLAEIPVELLEAAAVDEEHLRILRSLDLRSYIVAPLVTRDEVLGAITFVYAESGRRYSESDLAFVEDISRRAATAIENATLVRSLREAYAILEEQTEELHTQAAQMDEQAMELEIANDDLQATVDRLGRSENLLAEAQGAAHLGSWEWDVPTNTVTWSDELYRLFELEPRSIEVTFESYLERIHPDDVEATRATIQRAFEERSNFVFDHRIVRADGVIRHLHCRGRALLGDGETPVRMMGSAQDVTEERLAEQELMSARTEAERANKAKSDFLASMSHELRTPLNAIGGHADLMEMEIHGPVTPEQRTAFSRIKANQQHLLGLINDVLQFAKVEAGRLEIRDEPFRLDLLVRDTMAMLEPQARSRELGYTLAPLPSPLSAQGDEERVRQILVNLLSNAIKFTEPQGSIDVSVSLSDRDVEVSVADSGKGIPAEMLDAIFDPFVQVGRDRTSTQQGVGLGLAISRDLARSMGGDIHVQSEVGVGSTFTLVLAHDSGGPPTASNENHS